MALILASASPRRKELLRLITNDFTVAVSQADETLPVGIPPDQAVKLLAAKKAQAVAQNYFDDIVIGADTVVALENKILGKPKNGSDAAQMLQSLSGKTHEVYTGVCIISKGRETAFLGSASVKFAAVSDKEISDYVASGECLDKAGAYGIQGLGARYIEYIKGDYYSVMGLPVQKLYKQLQGLMPL